MSLLQEVFLNYGERRYVYIHERAYVALNSRLLKINSFVRWFDDNM